MKNRRFLIIALIAGILVSSFGLNTFGFAAQQTDKDNEANEENATLFAAPTPPPELVINNQDAEPVVVKIEGAVYGDSDMSVTDSVYNNQDQFAVITSSNDVLSEQDIAKWFAEGITMNEIMEADVLSKSYNINIQDILQQLKSGNSFEEQRKALAKNWLTEKLESSEKEVITDDKGQSGKGDHSVNQVNSKVIQNANSDLQQKYPTEQAQLAALAYSEEVNKLLLIVYDSYQQLSWEQILEAYSKDGDQYFADIVKTQPLNQRTGDNFK